MSDAVDFIFGDQESTKGIRFQQDDNRRRQEFLEEQSALGRRDILDIFPRGQESLQQGYRAAIDVATRAPITQNKIIRDASTKAQQNILGGMDEYRRAIMGLPSRIDETNMYRNPLGLSPVYVGAGEEIGNTFSQSQRPINLGSQAQDIEEQKRRRNTDAPSWRSVMPEKAANAYPEQYRDPVRYDFKRKQTTGGVDTPMPQLYSQALSGGTITLPDGSSFQIPSWSNL